MTKSEIVLAAVLAVAAFTAGRETGKVQAGNVHVGDAAATGITVAVEPEPDAGAPDDGPSVYKTLRIDCPERGVTVEISADMRVLGAFADASAIIDVTATAPGATRFVVGGGEVRCGEQPEPKPQTK